MSKQQSGAMDRIKLVLCPPPTLAPGSVLLAMQFAAEWHHPTIIGFLPRSNGSLEIAGLRIANMCGFRLYRITGEAAGQGSYPG